jgi:two-component system OmpR family response regulator
MKDEGAPGGPQQHVVVVDDDEELRNLLSQFLCKHGFKITGARSGTEMRKILGSMSADLVILDVMLPGEDGLVLCRELRAGSSIPIIMLTAMGDETDRIVGIELGADDYLAKPFNPRELLARIRGLLRRASLSPPSSGKGNKVTFAGWELDLARRELLSPRGVVTELTTGEYDLLLAFIEHPERVLTRDQLLDFARGRAATPFDRAIDVQVSRLRRKLESDSDGSPLIKTVRGAGYVLASRVERS